MRKEVISKKQCISMMLLFMMGTNLILGAGLKAGKDAWIAISLSTIISLPLAIIFYKIRQLYPENNLYEILELVFGKIIGKSLVFIYILFTLHLSAILLSAAADFIKTVGLFSTPRFVHLALTSILSVWVLKEGIETLGRWSELMVFVVVITVILTLLLLLPQMEVIEFKPVLYDNIDNMPKAIFSTITFPFSQLIFFSFAVDKLNNNNHFKDSFILSTIIGGIILTIAMSGLIAVISEDKLSSSYFVAYEAIRLLNIGTFLERIEIVATLAFLIGVFIKITICQLAACKGISKLIDSNDYRFAVVPTVLLTNAVCLILYDSVMETTEFTKNFYPYYALPFQIILPIIIYIGCIIKNKKKKPWISK